MDVESSTGRGMHHEDLQESLPLLKGESGSHAQFRTYKSRFWILLQVSFLSFNQSLFWISFSPIADNAKEFFGVPDSTITWLMNAGVIGGMVGIIPCSFYLAGKTGLRFVCIITGVLQAIAMVIRLIPWLLKKESTAVGIVVVFVAQTIVGMLGAAVMAAPPLLSAQWFAQNERTTATAVAALSNNFGSAVGFLLGPWLVHNASEVPKLLIAHAGLSVINLIMILIYFPAKPPTPPSKSQRDHGSEGSFGQIGSVVTNKDCMLIALGGGIVYGVFNVWSGNFDQILKGVSDEYTQSTLGWLGFGATMAVIVGGLIIGPIADMFKRRMHIMLTILGALTTIFMALFTFALPTKFSQHTVIILPYQGIFALIIASGLTLGACIPLMFEVAAEMTYPAPESSSALIIILILNAAAMIYLIVTPMLLDEKVLNLVITGCSGLAVLLFLGTRVKYVRADYERRSSSVAVNSL